MTLTCRTMRRALRQCCFTKGGKMCALTALAVTTLLVVRGSDVTFMLRAQEGSYFRQMSRHWLVPSAEPLPTLRLPDVAASLSAPTSQLSPEAPHTPARFLAGIPRTRLSKLTIGIPTLKRPKGDYFLATLVSLFNESSRAEQENLTVVVMLADRDPTYNAFRLQQLQAVYKEQLHAGLLLVAGAPDTEHLFHIPNLKQTYNDSLDRVRWRSKQNLDYAALMEISANLSTYYLQIEDDVLAAPHFVRHIETFVQKHATKAWAGLEVSNQGFIGKLFHSADLNKLVTLLRTFYLEMPCDFIIGYFYRLMVQNKVILRQGNLFFHRGKFSSMKDVVRRTEDLPPSARKGFYGDHQNPKGKLYSSLKPYKKHVLAAAYDPTASLFFWAPNVKQGDHVTLVFSKPRKVERVIVQTGFTVLGVLKDYARNASLHLGKRTSKPKANSVQCVDAQRVGTLTNGVFNETLDWTDDVACLSVIIDETQTEWLALTELVVFPGDAK